MHPDAAATIDVDGRRRWIYLEVDRGTAELRRYGLKLRRYAHFCLSGSWRREYATFPEVRIVTAHWPRMRRMLAEVEDAKRSFKRDDHDALMAGLVVAVTWESAFLADPSGAVWTPIFAADRRESPLLAGGADAGPAASGSSARISVAFGSSTIQLRHSGCRIRQARCGLTRHSAERRRRRTAGPASCGCSDRPAHATGARGTCRLGVRSVTRFDRPGKPGRRPPGYSKR